MARKINPTLLFESLCWVLYQYAKQSAEAQRARPLRLYVDGDGAAAATCIRFVRHAYRSQMRAFELGKRAKPDFEVTKALVMESLKLQHGWDEETRNFYSSIVSTYMTWERLGKSAVNQHKLAVVVTYGKMFLQPNHRIRTKDQGILL